jgi:hypothetical protein
LAQLHSSEPLLQISVLQRSHIHGKAAASRRSDDQGTDDGKVVRKAQDRRPGDTVSYAPGFKAIPMSIDDIFGATGQTNWAQECARAALIFFYGLILVRIAGRRVFGQWTAIDIIVAIVTGSTLSRALTGNADLFGTLAATTLLMALHWTLTHASARSPALSRLLEGPPVRLAEKGNVDRELLRRHAISQASLEQALRGAGIENPAGARLIVLEPSGKISVLKRH